MKTRRSPLAWTRSKQRRAVSLKERLQPCQCCGYDLSHRHHLYPISRWGETNLTIQLCANCHELYHIVFDVVKNLDEAKRNDQVLPHRSAKILVFLDAVRPKPDPQLRYLINLAEAALEAQSERLRVEREINEQMWDGIHEIFELFFPVPVAEVIPHVPYDPDAYPEFDEPRGVLE